MKTPDRQETDRENDQPRSFFTPRAQAANVDADARRQDRSPRR
jgi:hypothetical protein